jgi:MFS family permease
MARRVSTTGIFAAGCAVSALGTGAVYPVNVIYLHLVRGLPIGLVGLSITVTAVAALLSAPVAGNLAERFGGRTVTVIALVLQACGAVAMIEVRSAPAAVAAMAVQGLGSGCFYAALTPLVAQIIEGPRRVRLLSLRYAVNNAGIGAGAVLGGLAIARFGTSGYIGLYLTNAVSFLIFAAVLSALPVVADTWGGQPSPGLRDCIRPLADPRFRRLLLVQLLIVSGGYAQIDSSIPLYAKQRLHLSPIFIGAIITINTVLVVALQAPATRWVSRRDRVIPFRALGLTWSLAMLVGGAGGLIPHVATAALIVAISIFSVGECLYTPAFQAVLLRTSGEQELGRYAALASMTWTVALLAAPALGIALVQLPWPGAYWLTLSIAGLAIVALSTGQRIYAGNTRCTSY